MGGKSASRVGLVITFFCLFVCFFLYVSLLAIFPPCLFIWHLRVGEAADYLTELLAEFC